MFSFLFLATESTEGPQYYWNNGEDLSENLTFLYNIMTIKMKYVKFQCLRILATIHMTRTVTKEIVHMRLDFCVAPKGTNLL